MKQPSDHSSANKPVRSILWSDILKDDRVLKSMIKTGSLFHMLMTLLVKN